MPAESITSVRLKFNVIRSIIQKEKYKKWWGKPNKTKCIIKTPQNPNPQDASNKEETREYMSRIQQMLQNGDG